MSDIVNNLAARHGQRIHELLKQTPGGLTDFEIAKALDVFLSSVNAARNSLMRQGKVHASIERRPSGRGGMATVWRAA